MVAFRGDTAANNVSGRQNKGADWASAAACCDASSPAPAGGHVRRQSMERRAGEVSSDHDRQQRQQERPYPPARAGLGKRRREGGKTKQASSRGRRANLEARVRAAAASHNRSPCASYTPSLVRAHAAHAERRAKGGGAQPKSAQGGGHTACTREHNMGKVTATTAQRPQPPSKEGPRAKKRE